MQSNDNILVPLRPVRSFPETLRSLREIFPWLEDDKHAQWVFEEIESLNVSRSNSRLSTLPRSSSSTVASVPNLPLSDMSSARIENPPSNIPLPASCDNNSLPTFSDFPAYQNSADRARYLGQWNTMLFINQDPKKPTKTSRGLSLRAGTPVQQPFECPLCGEMGVAEPIQRIQDLKRHFTKLHQNHEVYICRHPDCGLAFDRRGRYESHFKKAHSRAVNGSQDALVRLQPRLVFACGFSICRHFEEAQDARDAEEKIGKYFDHIIKHLSGDRTLEWKYEVRLRNLMHQKGLKACWKGREKACVSKWQPQPHNSFVLAKMAETRCYSDAALLVKCVNEVGYPPHNVPDSQAFELPHNLSSPLEVHLPTDSSHDTQPLRLGVPDQWPINHPVWQTPIPMDPNEHQNQLLSINQPYVSAPQMTDLPHPYNMNPSSNISLQYGHYLDSTHQDQVAYDTYSTTPFPSSSSVAIPPHQTSQYPSSPLDWGCLRPPRSGYQDMAIDPRILPGTDHSTDLDAEFDLEEPAQDYS